jgi:predicted membrane protein
MTFWQYVKIGLKEFFSTNNNNNLIVNKKWTTKVIEFLGGIIIGSLNWVFFIWIFKSLNILDKFVMGIVWMVIIAAIIDLIALFIFLVISWKRSVRDCWDKFI